MNVPLVDLKAQHEEIREDLERALARVYEKTSFILGPAVAEFEEEFARFMTVRHCIGVANGTDALELIVRAAGIGQGDEVIMPANTFMATPLAVMRAGATPVLVDSDARYHLIDPSRIEAAVTPRTKAIMPVHLFGQVAPMKEIMAIASARGLVVLEDAAQAQGSRQNGRSAARFGLAAGTSFYPGKNLGAYGDAGAVMTDSDEVARTVRALRNYGSETKYYHPAIGFNSRLDSMQAAVLSAKLKRLDRWNGQRREAAKRYDALLADIPGVTLPETLPGNEHIWHLYVVRVPRRDEVLKRLQEKGVGAGIHYPVPCHLQGALAHLGYKEGDFPVAEKAAAEILSLPMYSGITAEQQEFVAAALREAVGKAA